jgi:hypothetical protein
LLSDFVKSLIKETPADERAEILAGCWIAAFSDGRLWREKTLLLEIGRQLNLRRGRARLIEEQVRSGRLQFETPRCASGKTLLFELVFEVASSDGKLTAVEQQSVMALGAAAGITDTEIRQRLLERGVRQEASAAGRRDGVGGASRKTDAAALVGQIRLEGAAETAAATTSETMKRFAGMLLAHLVPLYGALFGGWDVATILALYWLENVVTGIFSGLRIRLAQARSADERGLEAFFGMHYGLFTVVHGVFLVVLAAEFSGDREFSYSGWLVQHWLELLAAVVMIIFDQARDHWGTYVAEQQYLRTTKGQHFFRPYPRIFVLHLTVIGGGFLASQSGLPAGTIVLLMVLLHLGIESLILVCQLPPAGIGGWIRAGLAGGGLGMFLSLFPLMTGTAALFGISNLAAGVVDLLSPSMSLQKTLNGLFVVPPMVCVALLMAVVSGIAGLTAGILEHAGRLNLKTLRPAVPISLWIGTLLSAIMIVAFLPEAFWAWVDRVSG